MRGVPCQDSLVHPHPHPSVPAATPASSARGPWLHPLCCDKRH